MVMQVAHCGGISELHRLASYTETYDVAFAPHCPLGPIALAACMQVDITAPNCELSYASSTRPAGSHESHLPVFIQEMSLQVRILLETHQRSPETTSR